MENNYKLNKETVRRSEEKEIFSISKVVFNCRANTCIGNIKH
jgi:hypothetical protein